MSMTKFARAEIVGVKSSPHKVHTASLAKFAEYDDYRTDDGFIYVRVRAISSRVNRNHDGWPSDELAKSFRTFIGKPIFVDHHNHDPQKARGVVVDAALHVEDLDKTASLDPYYSTAPDNHKPPTWVELLMETDAKSFPKLAKAVIDGDIDGVSMGCFLPGAPIVLRDGTRKPIEDIIVGDDVLTHEGTIEPVTYVMRRPYSGMVHEITAYGQNEKAVVTDEHPIWIRREDFEGWVEAKDVHKGDYVMTPSRTSEGTNDVTIPAAKLAGYYLAEGNLGRDQNRNTHDHLASIEWNFSADEVDLVQDVIDCLNECGLKAAGPYYKNNCATIRCNDPEFAWNMQVTAGELSHGKRLADGVFDWSDDALRAMLLAYVAGDGTDKHKYGGVQWSTVSKTLAEQLHLICIRLGIQALPPAVLIPKQANRRTRYTTNVPESQIENLHSPATTAIAVKSPRAFVEDAKLYRKVKHVTSSYYNGDVYNFDVEGADSYVAANMAVHNCNVERSRCSVCSNWARSPEEYCKHIISKGAYYDHKQPDGTKISKRSYEDCYDIGFFEISYVFDPADETALIFDKKHAHHRRMVAAAVRKEADNPPPQSDMTNIPQEVDTLRQEQLCPVCGSQMDDGACETCNYQEPPQGFDNPDLEQAKELSQPQPPPQPEQPAPDQGQAPPSPVQPAGQGSPMPMASSYNTTNSNGVTNKMEWRILEKTAAGENSGGRINTQERPILPVTRQTSDKPVNAQTVTYPAKPVEATNKGEQMKTADGTGATPAGEGVSADKRVDVLGVGAVDDNAEQDTKHENVEKEVGITGPHTDTWSGDEGDSLGQHEPVTTEVDVKAGDNGIGGPIGSPVSSIQVMADGTWGDPGEGSGTEFPDHEPSRIDVTAPIAEPVGDHTMTFPGDDFHITDPITQQDGNEVGGPMGVAVSRNEVKTHLFRAMKIAEVEVDLGLTPATEKYERAAELEEEAPAALVAREETLSRVKTAGLGKTAKTAASASRMPSMRTAGVEHEAAVSGDEGLFL